MDGQMKKGILEMCILFRLSREETYGYEIMKRIRETFPEVHEATVYAILRRLAGDGLTETYLGGASNGPARKYYRVTPAGLESLRNDLREWHALCDAVRATGIAGNDLPPPPNRD